MKNLYKYGVPAIFIMLIAYVFVGMLIQAAFIKNISAYIPEFIILIVTATAITFSLLHNKRKDFLSVSVHSEMSDAWFFVILTLAATVPRIVWINLNHIPPISDFKTYHTMATALSEGVVTQKLYTAMFPHIIGYPFVLSLLYRLFGATVLTAQYFNVFCCLASSFTIYYICKKQFNNNSIARTCGIIYALWPSQIFYVTIISTEALYTLLFLLCVLIYIYNRNNFSAVTRLLMFGLLGIICSLSNAIRPISLVFIIAVLTDTLFSLIKDKTVLKTASVLVMLLLYLGTNACTSQIISKAVDRPIAKNSFGYTFLVGSNIESGGGWNADDANLFFDLYESGNYTLDEVNAILTNKGIDNIKSNFPQIIPHYLHKSVTFLCDDIYGVLWNKLSYESANNAPWDNRGQNFFLTLSQLYYAVALLMSVYAVIFTFTRKNPDDLCFFILIFLGFSASFVIAEVQSRYHYPVLPMLAILASYGMCKLHVRSRE